MLRQLLWLVAAVLSTSQALSGRVIFPDELDPPVSLGRTSDRFTASDAIFLGRSLPEEELLSGVCASISGKRGFCVPLTVCQDVTSLNGDENEGMSQCVLGDGTSGVCCVHQRTGGRALSGDRGIITSTASSDSSIVFSDNELRESSVAGSSVVKKELERERQLLQKDLAVKKGTPSFGQLQFFKTTSEAIQLSQGALKVIEASRQLQQQSGLTSEESAAGLRTISFKPTILKDACPPQLFCAGSKYRTIDGSCNNLVNTRWGKSLTALQRISNPDYNDGVWAPRRAKSGAELPSARFVSANVIGDFNSPRKDLTQMVMQWGQFIDHDLTHVPIFTFQNGSGIECCSPDGRVLAVDERHSQCLPIEIPATDPFYSKFDRRCMNFVRSLLATRPDCTFGFAEQLNQLTHWLDGSMVYGSTKAVAVALRAFKGGRMFVATDRTGREILPTKSHVGPDGTRGSECFTDVCFTAGDSRVNEQPMLTAMHTIWVREHNRIAAALLKLNPRWTDEVTYHEARRIVIAEMQHITYNEWLPIILGNTYMKQFKLVPLDTGYFEEYDPELNPTITNEFAAAAFRMGHSLIQGKVHMVDARSDKSFTLSQMFNDASFMMDAGVLDSLLRGLLEGVSQNFDNSITEELTTKLFRGTELYGFDLAALNLQRARDHGIPGYNTYRQVCGMKKASSFDDLSDVFTDAMVQVLKRLYKDVDDIDLFIGGISEKAHVGSLLGPTFLCLVGDQFARLRRGDRFFYDLGGQNHSFTEAQLTQIRKSNLARIVCDNSDGELASVQPLAFLSPTGINSKVPCNSDAIPVVRLDAWKNERLIS